ncbi:hypothetical protein ACPCHU_15930 [Bacillus bombysepticus]
MKKYILLSFIIFIVIIYAWNNNSSKDEKLNYKPPIIVNDWHNNITTTNEDTIMLQYPLYIPKSNYTKNDPEFSVKSNNNNFTIYQTQLLYNQEQFPWDCYRLTFNLKSQKIGEYKFKNGDFHLKIDGINYATSLGDSIINIIKKDPSIIEIVGGSAVIDRVENLIEYECYYNIKNNGTKGIIVKNVKTNDDILIKSSFANPVIINPQQQQTVKFKITLDDSVKNTLIQPLIIYDDKNLVGTPIIIADPVYNDKIEKNSTMKLLSKT